VQYEIKGGGSGTGFSYWTSFAHCGRRGSLDDHARKENLEGSSSSMATVVGTLVHALLECWYRGDGIDRLDFQWDVLADFPEAVIPVKSSSVKSSRLVIQCSFPDLAEEDSEVCWLV